MKNGSHGQNINRINGRHFFYWDSSMQGWTATTRHGVTRKRSTKRLKHIKNLFRKNLQLKGVC